MGNSLLSNGHIQLGSCATINFKKTKHLELFSEHRECWTVSYIVDGSTIRLMLDRVCDKDGDAKELRFQFSDSKRKGEVIFFFINRAEEDLLEQIKFNDLGRFYDTKFVNEACNPWGGVTKTNAFFHGSGKGLLVVEEKRKNGDEMPCIVTVAHYYVVSSGNVTSQNEIDIGLSIVVDVQVSNDQLVVSAEGPVQHPSSALLYMFQQVSRTRMWKRTTCPHCAETQRRRGQSETESEDRNNLQPARLHAPVQNARVGFLNNEDIMGNGNGNIIAPREINLNFYERRQQRMFWQSESENESEDGNNLLPARLRCPRQNGGTILTSHGATRANYNSNFRVNQLFLRGR